MIGSGIWRRLAAPSLLLTLLATSPADAGVLLRYKASPGDTANYQMVMEGSTTVFVADRRQKTDLNTEIYLKQEVDDVSDTGVIGLTTVIESGRINVNNQTSVIPNVGQRVRTEMQPNGAVINTVGMNQQLNLSQMQLIFPDDPVQIGTKWSNKIPPSLQVPVSLQVTYKIVAFESIKDFKCIKILSRVRSGKKSKIEGLKLDVKADGVIYFAYEKGLMVKNEVKSSMDMVLKRVVNNKSESIITKMKMDMKMEWQY
jgi:hypothetical protein